MKRLISPMHPVIQIVVPFALADRALCRRMSGSMEPVMVVLLKAWVEAQRCAATLPVGETGGGVVQGRPSRSSVSDPLRRARGQVPKQSDRLERSGGRAQSTGSGYGWSRYQGRES